VIERYQGENVNTTNYSSGLNETDTTVSDTAATSSYDATPNYDSTATSSQGTTSRMRAELSNLKRDLDDLMSRASSMSDMEFDDARALLMEKYDSMQRSVREIASEAGKQISHGADVTSDYVKEKPLQSVAIAAGIGLLLGALLRR
jgi:ElaB/YqjD/DUF883 family membrane-anchored ribosome-binding protein